MMKSCSEKEYSFIELFQEFVRVSQNGKRLQANGKRFSQGTIVNYQYSLKILEKFCRNKQFYLRIRLLNRLNARDRNIEKNYWKKFYKKFTQYLYDECGYYDNYVGSVIKNIRTFFGYLQKEKGLQVGSFYKQFYVRKEEIAIMPLTPDQLHFLIYDTAFETTLSKRMKEAKDFFVIGCTVGLRFSDMVKLQKLNVQRVGNNTYLLLKTSKTNTSIQIKLPAYAIDILLKYKNQRRQLLPSFNISNINIYVKRLAEAAGFTEPVYLTRNKMGVAVVQKKNAANPRFILVARIRIQHNQKPMVVIKIMVIT